MDKLADRRPGHAHSGLIDASCEACRALARLLADPGGAGASGGNVGGEAYKIHVQALREHEDALRDAAKGVMERLRSEFESARELERWAEENPSMTREQAVGLLPKDPVGRAVVAEGTKPKGGDARPPSEREPIVGREIEGRPGEWIAACRCGLYISSLPMVEESKCHCGQRFKRPPRAGGPVCHLCDKSVVEGFHTPSGPVHHECHRRQSLAEFAVGSVKREPDMFPDYRLHPFHLEIETGEGLDRLAFTNGLPKRDPDEPDSFYRERLMRENAARATGFFEPWVGKLPGLCAPSEPAAMSNGVLKNIPMGICKSYDPAKGEAKVSLFGTLIPSKLVEDLQSIFEQAGATPPSVVIPRSELDKIVANIGAGHLVPTPSRTFTTSWGDNKLIPLEHYDWLHNGGLDVELFCDAVEPEAFRRAEVSDIQRPWPEKVLRVAYTMWAQPEFAETRKRCEEQAERMDER